MIGTESEPFTPERETSASYTIQIVENTIIDDFVGDHSGEAHDKYWVFMGQVKEADGLELFTFGSGPCANLVFVSPGQKIKLGHLPYMFTDRSKHDFEKSNSEIIVEDLLKEFNGAGDWTLYLFALAPYDETTDAKKVRDDSANDLITRFSNIVVTCVDMSIREFGTSIYDLIVDPLNRKIQVSYRKISSKK